MQGYVLKEQGNWRVLIKDDTEPTVSNPLERDTAPYIIRYQKRRGKWGVPSKNPGPLLDKFQEFCKRADQRASRTTRAAVPLHLSLLIGSYSFARYVQMTGGVAVLNDLDVWYFTDASMFNDPVQALEGWIQEYNLWQAGDVYGWVLQHKRTYLRIPLDPDNELPVERQEDWETVDSVWGYIGADFVRECALEEFAHRVKDQR